MGDDDQERQSERSASSLPFKMASPIDPDFPFPTSSSAREAARKSPQMKSRHAASPYSSGFRPAEAGPSTSGGGGGGGSARSSASAHGGGSDGTSRSPARHRQASGQSNLPPRQQLAPPPLGPYVNPDRRYYAPKPAQERWLGPDGRRASSQERPALAPILRPPPPHIVAALAAANKEGTDTQHRPPLAHFRPPLSSSSLSSSSSTMSSASASYGHSHPSFHHFPPPQMQMSMSEPNRLLPTPPDSRGAGFPPPPLSRMPLPATHPHPYQHRQSLPHSSSGPFPFDPSRPHSMSSANSVHSEPMLRDLSAGSSTSGSSQIGGMTTVSAPVGQPELHFMRKKRTRALMTHIQQAGLSRLWKRTKFPTGSEREQLGQEIGLTPRQVQVWFQNQRQKGRKTLVVNGGVPDGEDPADYEDLQKSPRSRRLSAEQEEPISAWPGSSSSSASASTIWPVSMMHSSPIASVPAPMPASVSASALSRAPASASASASGLGLEPTCMHHSSSPGRGRHAKGVPVPHPLSLASSRARANRHALDDRSRSRSPTRRSIIFGTVHHTAPFSHALPPEPPHALLGSRLPSPGYERWEQTERQAIIARDKQQHSSPSFSQRSPLHRHFHSTQTHPHSPNWDSPAASATAYDQRSSARPPSTSGTGALLSPPRTMEADNSVNSSWQKRRRSPSESQSYHQRANDPAIVPPMARSRSHTGPTPSSSASGYDTDTMSNTSAARPTHLPPALARIALDAPIDRGIVKGEVDLPSIGFALRTSPSPSSIGTNNHHTSRGAEQRDISGRSPLPRREHEGTRPKQGNLSSLLD